MYRSRMAGPLINPSLVAQVTPSTVGGAGAAARRTNAQAYDAAMREANAPAKPQPQAQARQDLTGSVTREAPFGVDRPRYVRPGSVLDIRV